MDEDEVRALAESHAPEALRALASIAINPNASTRVRDDARRTLAERLQQLGASISPGLRRELEDAIHGK